MYDSILKGQVKIMSLMCSYNQVTDFSLYFQSFTICVYSHLHWMTYGHIHVHPCMSSTLVFIDVFVINKRVNYLQRLVFFILKAKAEYSHFFLSSRTEWSDFRII